MFPKQRARRWRAACPLLGNWNFKIIVKGKVIDAHGLDRVSIKVEGQGWKKASMHGEQIKNFEKSYNIDWGRSIGGGYDIKVHAEDVNGNVAKYKTHMDGVLGALLKLILKILTAIAEAIAALAALFIDWIWKAIRGMFDCVFKPIKNEIKNFVKSVGKAFSKAKNELNSLGSISKSKNNLQNIFQGNLFYGIIALGIILLAVNVLVYPFIGLVGSLAGKVVDFLVPMIIAAVGATMQDGFKNIINLITNGDIDAIGNIAKSLIPNSGIEPRGISTYTIYNAIMDGIDIGLVICELMVLGVMSYFSNFPCWQDILGLFISIAGLVIGLFYSSAFSTNPLEEQIGFVALGFTLCLVGLGLNIWGKSPKPYDEVLEVISIVDVVSAGTQLTVLATILGWKNLFG